MEWLNYHHLLYFWLVARSGSVTAAASELRLAQSTVSAQIHQLEEVLGERLLRRQGRRLVLTDVGRVVLGYAEEIFGLGREMLDALKGRPTGRPLRFAVGIADQVPKLVAYRVLEPALHLESPVRLVAIEGKSDALFAELALHRLDVVLTDAPLPASSPVRGFNHLLGECGVTFFAPAKAAAPLRRTFPRSLNETAMLLPAERTTLRRAVDTWLRAQDVHPRIVGEFEDSALLMSFGQAGAGVFAAPSAIEREIARQYGVKAIGRIDDARERFYAISAERRLRHPAVVAISEAARTELFETAAR